MKRGEIWWARIDKDRPVLLLSRDEAYEMRAMVIVAPATTTIRGFSLEIGIGRREGLSRDCVVNCDSLVTVPKVDLIRRAGAVTAAKLRQVDSALRFALGVD